MTQVNLNAKAPQDVKLATEVAVREEKLSIYTYVYQLMVDGLGIQQENFSHQADSLNENAARQKEQLNTQQSYEYKQLPPNAQAADIAAVQIYNNDIDKKKSQCQNTVSALKQTASVTMSESKVSVDNMSQKGAMTSSFIKALDTVLKSINEMNKSL